MIQIEHLIRALKIFRKYRRNYGLKALSNQLTMLEVQEPEFVEITAKDRVRLHNLGWRFESPNKWRLLTAKGLEKEKQAK